jgi:hypothetical protein
MNFRLVFDAKRSLLNKDPYQLEGLLRDLEPTIHILNNGDRTLSIYSYDKGQDALDSLISQAMILWLGELSFNPILLYNLFNVGGNNYIVRV